MDVHPTAPAITENVETVPAPRTKAWWCALVDAEGHLEVPEGVDNVDENAFGDSGISGAL